MNPIYEKIKGEYTLVMNFEYVDVSKENKLAYTYKIEYTPTFIIVDEKGNELDKLVGYVSETKFREFVGKWGNK